MVEEYTKVVVNGVERTVVALVHGKEYALGYSSNRLDTEKMRRVNGTYFGNADDQHVFFAQLGNMEVVRYTLSTRECYLQSNDEWLDEDDDGTWFQFLHAKFDSILPNGSQRDFVLARLKKAGELEKRLISTPTASPPI